MMFAIISSALPLPWRGGEIVLEDGDVERKGHLAVLVIAVQRAQKFPSGADLDGRTAVLRRVDVDSVTGQNRP